MDSQFKQILANLNNPDNNVRQQAENFLNEAKAKNLVSKFDPSFLVHCCSLFIDYVLAFLLGYTCN